ncbi:MAG: hypothetical protein KBT55_03460 [Porticoccus sp.]|nr:hypothetical protein [Porticoccus sp.]
MISPAGHLLILLPLKNQGGPVQISSTRPRHVHQLFCDKPLKYVLQTTPLLFNVCRHAQTIATARAMEGALGYTATKSTEQLRDTLVSLEALYEHLWKLLIDLPPLLGLPVRHQEMAKVSQQLKPLMDKLHQACNLIKLTETSLELKNSPTHLDLSLTHELGTLLFGQTARPEGSWSELQHNKGLAGNLLRAIAPLDWPNTFHSHQLPAIDSTEARTLLATQDPHQFIHQYSSAHSNRFETGALLRMFNQPLVKQSREEHNHCLSMRMTALLVETDLLLQGTQFPRQDNKSITSVSEQGHSEVETTRGRLTHALSLKKNSSGEPVIKNIAIVAPTDWNFHPNGAAAQLLSEIPTVSKEKTYQSAELLIQLINPCVAYHLEVTNSTTEASYHA